MTYTAFDITERMKKVKSEYLSLTVPTMSDPYHPEKYKCFGTGDRLITLGYLRGFEKHQNALTTRLRTSFAEAEELYQSKPMICGDELLLGHLYLPKYTEEEQAEYDRLCAAFPMSSHTFLMRSPRKDHICLDFEKLLRVGINGLKREINDKLSALDINAANIYPDMDVLGKYEFYHCCLIELNAVSDLAARYSQAALSLAEEKSEPRRSELIKLGNMLKKVPDNPAESFWEALQSVQFFLSTLFGLYPLGRPDRYLYPYYKKDIESGTLTRKFAQELIDNFCLYVSDRVFSRAACGFIVGGKDADGNLTENELTYMFITALDHLKLPDPNGALAVCDETSDELLKYCAEILSHGTSHPAFYNDKVITNSLVENYKVSPEDAVNYIHSTCAEISVAGRSKAHSTPLVIDLPSALLDAAKKDGINDFDILYEQFIKEISKTVSNASLNYAIRIMESARIGNEAMRICTLIENCIARGKSIYEGGEKYMFIQPIFIGFATAVDSLVALSRLVYSDKKLTLEDFRAIVESNFSDDESLRQYIINKLPHYGNDDPEADLTASRLAESIKGIFGKEVPLWDHMMPGTFSYINHATRGAQVGATFDGRLAGSAYSDGCCAVQGRDVSGPSAMILSLTSWDQSTLLGGMVVNMKFSKSSFDPEKIQNFISVIRTFIERGGIELQINVVDRATLEDARLHPEDHRDLIVRIGGYSDYFSRLTPVLQQEIIERTQY